MSVSINAKSGSDKSSIGPSDVGGEVGGEVGGTGVPVPAYYLSAGDSIGTGAGATIPANGFIGLLNADLGVTFDNIAVSTAMVMDHYTAVYGKNLPAGSLSILNYGTNDQAKYDVDATKRGYFIDGLRAYAIWLSAETKLVAPANGVTFTGVWENIYAGGVYGSSVVGAKASFVANGDTFSLGLIRQYLNASTFSISIDGVGKGTFNTGGDVRTLLGASFGPRAMTFTDLGPGNHTVEITVISADASNVVYFHWFSVHTPKSQVVINNIPFAIAYTYGGSSVNVGVYNGDILTMIGELAISGLNVVLANINAIIAAPDMYDNVHPNNAGHAKYVRVIKPLINQLRAAEWGRVFGDIDKQADLTNLIEAKVVELATPGAATIAFGAYSTATSALGANVYGKISLGAIEFDSSGIVNTATSRITPTVAGYYHVNASAAIDTTISSLTCAIYKNGVVYKAGANPSSAANADVSTLVYCNGTTDYLEFWFRSQAAQGAAPGIQNTWINGFRV